MKMLLFEWNAFMQRDLEVALQSFPIEVKYVSYEFEDWDRDEFFYDRFSGMIKEEGYDVVFSLNFFPVVAEVCNAYNVMYISWVYDSPMHIRRIETLQYSCNRVFVFDRGQCDDLRAQGIRTVYHMPLAVNAERLAAMDMSDDCGRYSGEIGFVGKLYESDFDYLMGPLNETQRERIRRIVENQRKEWGQYVLDELVTDEFLAELNKRYSLAAGDKDYRVKKEELLYSLSAQVTRLDRLEILQRLSERHDTVIYTYDNTEMLSQIRNGGSVKYYSEMPKVFRNSTINLNIALSIIKTGIPLRVLDILGAGGFLITSYKKEIEENFRDGEELVIYKSIEELVEKADYYLKHEEERCRIAGQGFEKVKREFHFEGQLRKIFEISGI